MAKIAIVCVLIVSGALGLIVSLYTHGKFSSSEEITEIQTFHYPTLFVKQLAGDPLAGEKIFKEFCASCHANPPLIDIKAPRVGDKTAWGIREKMGIATLLKITVMGVGAMPARGGCFECSDDQLRETIRYMVERTKAE